MLLIALLHKTDCTFFCALSKLTSVDPTKIGHIKRKTFLQFFGLLFRYHQTVEMPASTNHFDKIFHTLFYSYFFCFGANSQFHHFFIVFSQFLRSFNKELFLHFADNAHYFNKFIFSQKKKVDYLYFADSPSVPLESPPDKVTFSPVTRHLKQKISNH